ncbi:MAG: hypothetical protein ACRD4V_12660 [Candidatus Acidiferrales bacterium]
MNYLKRTASVLISFALIFAAVTPASVAGQTIPPPPLSSAVVQTTVQSIVSTYNHQKQGTLQPGDLQSTATALRILFAYMQEQGVNAKLDAALRGNSNILSAAQTSTIAQKLFDELQADGISSVTLGQISNLLSMSQKNSSSIVKAIQQKGISQVESEMVQEFLMLSRTTGDGAVASNTANARRDRGAFRTAGFYRLAVSKPLTQDQCTQLANLSAEATGLAIIAALSGAEPVAVAFEVAALAYDAEAAAGGCD